MEPANDRKSEFIHLVAGIVAPCAIIAFIILSSPCYTEESFYPEILMIMIPGTYCFYALRQILSINTRTFLLVLSLMTAVAILAVSRYIPQSAPQQPQQRQETAFAGNHYKPQPVSGHASKKRDFNALSKSLREGFR